MDRSTSGITSGWSPLAGKRIALTGRFASMPQQEMGVLLHEAGAEYVLFPTRTTHLVVLGQDGWPLRADGCPTARLARAHQIKASGYPLTILSEEDFLKDLLPDVEGTARNRLCTIADLSRLLSVPGERIRRWLRSGLIAPRESLHRVAYFDFGQVRSAQQLCELLSKGTSLPRIRQSLEQLARWLPGLEVSLEQVALLENCETLLGRRVTGELIEPSGQFWLEFGAREEPVICANASQSADDWFEEALRYEEEGDWCSAETAYRAALALEADDPVLHFNLANVLYAQGLLSQCLEEFTVATSLDPQNPDGWNNLGNVEADLDHPEEAIAAFRRALQFAPTYADAHYNLAQLLTELGQYREAGNHWRLYLEYDPEGTWADVALAALRVIPR